MAAFIGRALPEDGMGRPLTVLQQAASTSDTLRRDALRGAPEGAAVLALQQTRGRGRRGRRWHSPAGCGLYLSVLLRPAWPAALAGWLSVIAGLSVRRAIEELGVRDARIKHPNDVLVRGRKIAGILVEPRLGRHGMDFAVVGVGMNLAQREADFASVGLEGRATSCALEGVAATVESAAAAVLREMGRLYRSFDALAAAEWLREWERYGGRPEVPEVSAAIGRAGSAARAPAGEGP